VESTSGQLLRHDAVAGAVPKEDADLVAPAGAGIDATTRTGKNAGSAGVASSTALRSLHRHQESCFVLMPSRRANSAG
jgi:hypothetical protein